MRVARADGADLVAMVVPHVVVEELDALKSSERPLRGARTVGAAARGASRWLLDAVQRQKYGACSRGGALVPAEWPLHVETSRDAAMDRATAGSNDEAIVALCVMLAQHITARVILVSDDTNARMLGEIENLSTLSLEATVVDLGPRGQPLRDAARHLLMLSASPQHANMLCVPGAVRSISGADWERLALWHSHARGEPPGQIDDPMGE